MRSTVALAAAVMVFVFCPTPRAAADGGWTWPVQGRVLTLYSNDNARPYAGGMHRGIDVAAEVGTTVVAARAGTVTHAGVVGSSGLVVAVRTAEGRYVTSYLHLSAAAVKKGDAVEAGSRIGATGTSGRPSVAEPHLHFGVRLADADDQYVDPLSLLPPLPGPAAAPAAPVPVPVPAAPEREAVPALAPAVVEPVRIPAPVRARPPLPHPAGTLHPLPARAPVSSPVPVERGRGLVARREHVAAGPAPVAAPVRRRAVQWAAPERGHADGRMLVLAGLGLLGLVLFGGVAARVLVRAHVGAGAAAAASVTAVRDRFRIGPALRRLLRSV
jgi:hypothetical protein